MGVINNFTKVNIRKDLHAEIKNIASEEHLSITKFIELLLYNYLKEKHYGLYSRNNPNQSKKISK